MSQRYTSYAGEEPVPHILQRPSSKQVLGVGLLVNKKKINLLLSAQKTEDDGEMLPPPSMKETICVIIVLKIIVMLRFAPSPSSPHNYCTILTMSTVREEQPGLYKLPSSNWRETLGCTSIKARRNIWWRQKPKKKQIQIALLN